MPATCSLSMISAAAFAVNMPSAMHVGPILSCWNPMWPSFFLLLKTSICPCGPWPAFSAVVQKRLPRDNQSGCWKNPSPCCVSAQPGAIRFHPRQSVAKLSFGLSSFSLLVAEAIRLPQGPSSLRYGSLRSAVFSRSNFPTFSPSNFLPVTSIS